MPSNLDVKELYETYGAAIYRRCLYFLHSPSEAQDALHEVFVKIVEHADEFKGDSSPLTWVVRVTTNHCLNIIRAKKALWHKRYEAATQVDHQQRLSTIGQWERQKYVQKILFHISTDAQEAAVYYFVDDMSQEDAARAAKCSVPTLRKRLREFIREARQHIQREEVDAIFGPEPL